MLRESHTHLTRAVPHILHTIMCGNPARVARAPSCDRDTTTRTEIDTRIAPRSPMYTAGYLPDIFALSGVLSNPPLCWLVVTAY